jgi:hypothetical protein
MSKDQQTLQILRLAILELLKLEHGLYLVQVFTETIPPGLEESIII